MNLDNKKTEDENINNDPKNNKNNIELIGQIIGLDIWTFYILKKI